MQRLIVKILALVTFAGGPMVVVDRLKPAYGDMNSFLLGFSPVAVLVFSAVTVLEDEPTWFTWLWAWIGLVAALVVLAMDGWAAYGLVFGPTRGDFGLVAFGITVGPVAAAAYGWAARKTLFSSPGDAPG